MYSPHSWSPDMHIHLVGIGGTGLSAIARVLQERGFTISGSDKQASAMTAALAAKGIRIYIGHHAEQVGQADALIYTSAVDEEGQVEIRAAESAGIPSHRRAEIMQQVIGPRPTIAVAGTHGKTTTTAMLVHILQSCGQHPGFILGSTLPNGENASLGEDELFVIEADEYDDMFLGLRPETAIITNIEFDHPDLFPSLDDVIRSFSRFTARIPQGGAVVYCADDAGARNLVAKEAAGMEISSYGKSAGADLRLSDLRSTAAGCRANCIRDGALVADLCLSLVGEHNLFNAAAALLAAERYGIPIAEGASALSDYQGVDRRMSLRGDVAGLAILDDYAHHPTAIRASIRAARQRYPERQLIALWQPHTFSRTAKLWDEFVAAFAQADMVFVTEIYAAREQPVRGIDGSRIAAAIEHPAVHFAADFDTTLLQLREIIRTPSCLLIMSAGDAPVIGTALLNTWEDRAAT